MPLPCDQRIRSFFHYLWWRNTFGCLLLFTLPPSLSLRLEEDEGVDLRNTVQPRTLSAGWKRCFGIRESQSLLRWNVESQRTDDLTLYSLFHSKEMSRKGFERSQKRGILLINKSIDPKRWIRFPDSSFWILRSEDSKSRQCNKDTYSSTKAVCAGRGEGEKTEKCMFEHLLQKKNNSDVIDVKQFPKKRFWAKGQVLFLSFLIHFWNSISTLPFWDVDGGRMKFSNFLKRQQHVLNATKFKTLKGNRRQPARPEALQGAHEYSRHVRSYWSNARIPARIRCSTWFLVPGFITFPKHFYIFRYHVLP